MLTLNNLAEFPFIRFDAVELNYDSGSHQIANKCEVFASQLQKFPRLNEANSVCVSANISQKQCGYFTDQSQLLEHLRNQLLPIIGSRCRCEFFIRFKRDRGVTNVFTGAATNLITSILQMKQIINCSNVAFDVVIAAESEHLPVETISNWLHRNRNTDNGVNEFSNQSQQERKLEIKVAYISNVLEMLNHLKEVLFNCLRFLMRSKAYIGMFLFVGPKSVSNCFSSVFNFSSDASFSFVAFLIEILSIFKRFLNFSRCVRVLVALSSSFPLAHLCSKTLNFDGTC